jgi:hypothetical protein
VSEYSAIRKFANFIYNYPEIYVENEEITLVNATRTTGLANRLALDLKKYGFNIPEKKSISSTKDLIPRTEIWHVYNEIDTTGLAPTSPTILALQTLLQVPIQSQSMLKYSDLVGPNIEIVL